MNQLSALQSRLLLILKWYHEFCTQNNLRYYLLGGTMLGAARHSGFIPWDDDIDVGMPRRDYEQFLKLTQNKRFGNFTIEDMHTKNKDYCYGYAKIYDVNSTLVENTRYKIKRGIYIDLFPRTALPTKSRKFNRFFVLFTKGTTCCWLKPARFAQTENGTKTLPFCLEGPFLTPF